MREMLADLQRRGLIQQRPPVVTDAERLADIERRNADGYGEPGDIEWLVGRVRALTAERDDLIVERDKWKTRVTG